MRHHHQNFATDDGTTDGMRCWHRSLEREAAVERTGSGRRRRFGLPVVPLSVPIYYAPVEKHVLPRQSVPGFWSCPDEIRSFSFCGPWSWRHNCSNSNIGTCMPSSIATTPSIFAPNATEPLHCSNSLGQSCPGGEDFYRREDTRQRVAHN